MNALRNIRMLMQYTIWANRRLYAALDVAPSEMLGEARPGRPAGILGTLGHMWVVDLIWRAHLEAQEHGFKSRQLERPMPLEELSRAQSEQDLWYFDFCNRQSDQSLSQPIEFEFVDGRLGLLVRGDMLLHIVNHKTYHRGYVADMLYQSGLQPPTMDLPVFLRDAWSDS